MADHPLRPAIDRRLGRPLPHQLPNLTRAHPIAINLSPSGRIWYYQSFPTVIPYYWVDSHVLLTRMPLTELPSKLGLLFVRLACVKHAASVRSEPGSNSQIMILCQISKN